jgi:hypothetical protein
MTAAHRELIRIFAAQAVEDFLGEASTQKNDRRLDERTTAKKERITNDKSKLTPTAPGNKD